MPPKLFVRKLRLVAPLTDYAISFPRLDGLCLDLLENKDKLKANLPLIPRVRLPQARRDDSPDGRERRASDHRQSQDDAELVSALRPDGDAPRRAEPRSSSPPRGAGPRAEVESRDDGGEPSGGEEKNEEKEDEDAHLTPEERDKRDREEYTWRFRILKKQYPSVDVPPPADFKFKQVSEIKSQYDDTMRELELDENVDTYRTYLFGSWLAIEFACTQWIGIDLSGFTKHQGMMMDKYNKLLIELGEKKRGTWGSDLPVEVRLVGLVLFQAGIFYLIKTASDKFGVSVADLFSIFMGQRPGAATAAATAGGPGGVLGTVLSGMNGTNAPAAAGAAPAKKMRGPSQTAAELRTKRERSQKRSQKRRPVEEDTD